MEDLELALSIAESLQVDVKWQQGDVVLLDVSPPFSPLPPPCLTPRCCRYLLLIWDPRCRYLSFVPANAVGQADICCSPQNYAVMHSRRPWVGKRTVLAALWDEDDRIQDFDQGKDILKSSPRVPIVVS